MSVVRIEEEWNVLSFLEWIAQTGEDGAYVLMIQHYIFTAYLVGGQIVHTTLSVDDKCVLEGEKVFEFQFKKTKGVLDFYRGLKPNAFTMHEKPHEILNKIRRLHSNVLVRMKAR